MERDLTRTLVESTVRRTLKNIQESPERAIRNFIDLGLEFSNGPVSNAPDENHPGNAAQSKQRLLYLSQKSGLPLWTRRLSPPSA